MNNLKLVITGIFFCLPACGDSQTIYKDAGRLDTPSAPAAPDASAVDRMPDVLRDSTTVPDVPILVPDALKDSFTATDLPAPADAPKDTAPDLRDTTPDRPRIDPLPGHYTARLCEPALDGGTDDISPLSSFGFTILTDSAGAYWLRYAADNWAFQNTAVIGGQFFGQKGQGFDGRGGTGCPTDAFLIDGYFTSPISATGRYAAGYRCQITHEGCFIATLDNPPTEPGPEAMDGGTVLDASVD